MLPVSANSVLLDAACSVHLAASIQHACRPKALTLPHPEVICTATIAFFQRILKGNQVALAQRMYKSLQHKAALVFEVSTLQSIPRMINIQ